MQAPLPPIVLLNGPARSGKDTIAQAMYHRDAFVHVAKFASKLKDMVHKAFGLDVRHDHFEAVKDSPQACFHGKTPRQTYIAFSESFVKPFFGDGFFGVELREELLAGCRIGLIHGAIAISDSGFASEASELMKGFDRVLLVRIHRPGKTFDGDSRSYIELPGVRTIDVQNDSPGAPDAIARHILELL